MEMYRVCTEYVMSSFEFCFMSFKFSHCHFPGFVMCSPLSHVVFGSLFNPVHKVCLVKSLVFVCLLTFPLFVSFMFMCVFIVKFSHFCLVWFWFFVKVQTFMLLVFVFYRVKSVKPIMLLPYF